MGMHATATMSQAGWLSPQEQQQKLNKRRPWRPRLSKHSNSPAHPRGKKEDQFSMTGEGMLDPSDETN
jgi:hypothetical protein